MNQRNRRVLIRTLPLSNGNYGGVLQAYALQRALSDIGMLPATDLTTSKSLSPLAKSVARLVVRVMPSWFFSTPATAELRDSVLTEAISAPLAAFVAEHIAGVALYRARGTIDATLLGDYPNLIVGSDQVWRRSYGDVKSYLFDFVTDPNVRMISYAASFGHDGMEGYGKGFLDETRRLAARFDAVSVRESSAVELCARHWGVTARHHVDPTMLLPREHYVNLAAGGDAADLSPECVTYVLDESPTTRSVVDLACRRLGLAETCLIRKPLSHSAWRAAPERYRRPTVQTWLRAFAEARFVVTDSFHGTIFAILNNKPFIAVANASRGTSRFSSLLDTFGLGGRLVSSAAAVDVERTLDHEIDWHDVNRRLAAKRDEGIGYLRDALAATADHAARQTITDNAT